MKHPVPLIVIALAVAAAGGFAYFLSTRSGTAPAPPTAAVARGNVVETVDATGTVEAVTTVQVGTQVSGTIQSNTLVQGTGEDGVPLGALTQHIATLLRMRHRIQPGDQDDFSVRTLENALRYE